MKYARSTARLFAALLALALMILPLSALAEAAAGSEMNEVNIWGIMKRGTVVYRDATQRSTWGSAPRDLIVNVVAYAGDLAIVKNGSRYGCCSLNDFKPLTAGTMLKAGCRTRVYKTASARSRYVNVNRGLSVELVSLTDNCAQVRRGDYVGYVYIGHFLPAE